MGEAFDEVGIAYVWPAEGDEIRMMVLDRLFGSFLSVAAVADYWSGKVVRNSASVMGLPSW